MTQAMPRPAFVHSYTLISVHVHAELMRPAAVLGSADEGNIQREPASFASALSLCHVPSIECIMQVV